MSSFREALGEGRRQLLSAGVPDAAADAWYLLEYILDRDRSWYFLHMDEEMAEETEERYLELAAQRCARIPLQQILGRAWFMGLEFLVNGQVLIPRQDTEILVEEAQRRLGPCDKILDLCTGSGCILLSLLYNGSKCSGVGADISDGALSVARANSERLQIPARFVQSDLFEHISGKFDMIVSNPPYIPTGVIPNLMEEVRDHEPHIALDGGKDGLDFYRRILKDAPAFLKEQGWLLMEIGSEQGPALVPMMEDAGYLEVQIVKDLAGLDRVITGRRN